MSDIPRTITGVLRAPDGTPLANRSLTWFRARRRASTQGSSVIVDELFTTTLNANGEPVGTAVVPGDYLVRVRLADADRFIEVGVPEGSGTFDISDGVDTQAPPITPPLVAAAETARDAAQAAAQAAGDSETAAAASAEQAGRWGVYASTAAGLAATEVGDFFSVYNEAESRLEYYEHEAGGTADLVATIEALEDFGSDDIGNDSGVPGANVSEALDELDAGKQPADTMLDALAGLSSEGIFVRTGSGAAAARSIVGAGAVIVTDGDGVGDDPEILVPTQEQPTWDEGASTSESAISPKKLADAIDARATGAAVSLTEQTFAASTLFTFAHGLSGIPLDFRGFLRCATASEGFSVDDVLALALWQDSTTNGASMWADATNVYVRVPSFYAVFNPSGSYQVLTPANFRLFVRVWP